MDMFETVRRLVELAEVDLSDPPGWELDLELRRVERQFVHEDKLPGNFAIVCQEARKLSTSSTSRALLKLGEVNGWRRVEPCNVDNVRRLLSEAEIEALPDSLRRDRLTELHAYHTGIFARNQGQYDLEAAMQAKAAQAAENAGNLAGAAINRFCEITAKINLAVAKQDHEGFEGLAEELTKRAEALSAHIPTESSEYVRWVYLNAPIHVSTACLWISMKDDDGLMEQSAKLSFLQTTDPKLAEANQGNIMVAQACSFWSVQKPSVMSMVRKMAEYVLKYCADTTMPEYQATAHLLLARLGTDEECKTHLRAILTFSAQASQVKAIAIKELKRFEEGPKGDAEQQTPGSTEDRMPEVDPD